MVSSSGFARLCGLLLLPAAIALLGGCDRREAGGERRTAASSPTGVDSVVRTADGQPLGTVRFPTSCSADAQPRLERGLALLHNMTYEVADTEFQAAAALDPDCAIAYWGSAMSYLHPLWPDTVSADRRVAARELLTRARAAKHSSKRERAYITALEAYYTDAPDAADNSEGRRLSRYASGWEDVFRRYGDDPEAKLFYALAMLATASPSDKSYEKQRAAGALAEEVLAAIPQHPGAHHYIIHAYDSPALADRALAAARSYGSIAPQNSHALHMASHIFTRLGLWAEAIEANRRAADALAIRAPTGEVAAQHLHALDYLMYAQLQTGNDAAARELLEEVEALKPPYEDHAAAAYAFAAMPARYALERQDWAAARALPIRWPDGIPWDDYPHLVAIAEFARAIGGARYGDQAVARQAMNVLVSLQEQAAALDSAYDWGTQVAIQKMGAEAWLLYASGDVEEALKVMREAAEMESSTEKSPVTPGEVLPARELYADMLLAAGRYSAARGEYDNVLDRAPNRFNSLYGAGYALELNGDPVGAALYYRRLLDNCASTGTDRPQVRRAREAVAVLDAPLAATTERN